MRDQTRNLHPHAEAIAAMWLWGREYSRQSGGSMDFWDGRDETTKALVRRMVKEIREAPTEVETHSTSSRTAGG